MMATPDLKTCLEQLVERAAKHGFSVNVQFLPLVLNEHLSAQDKEKLDRIISRRMEDKTGYGE